MNENQFFITLVRHAESEGNVRQLFQGQDDYPLTDRGRRQAAALAKRLSLEAQSFDEVITSPLSRARETAAILAAALGMQEVTNAAWLEQDFGVWNPRSFRDPDFIASRPAFFTPYDQPGETGESALDLYRRGIAAVQSLLDRRPGKYLIVSHGALINMVLYAMLGIFPRPDFEGPRFPHANTGFSRMAYSPERHQWLLLAVNDHSHAHGI